MANIKSAAKRIEITERNRLRNKSYKSAVKTLMKRYYSAVSQYTSEPNSDHLDVVKTSMSAAYSKIDKAVKRGALHPNTGARRKSHLAKLYKQVDAPTTAV